MVKDPYRILNVPRSATQTDIKKSYRTLAKKYHPDRVFDPTERDHATASFAEISAAYALLSDSKKKAQYDHIYKYGGFDDVDGNHVVNERPKDAQTKTFSSQRNGFSSNNNSYTQQNATSSSPTTTPDPSYQSNRKRKSGTGIGYVCSDPLAFLWSQGKIQIRQTVAGIEVPNRLQGDGGLRFAFSAGHFSRSQTGIKQYSSTTTQFAQGKKFTRTETTTIYPDGRKEVIIEGNDCGEHRYYSTTTSTSVPKGCENTAGQAGHSDAGVTQHNDERLPWYVSAWSEIKDKLSMCYSPCAVTTELKQ